MKSPFMRAYLYPFIGVLLFCLTVFLNKISYAPSNLTPYAKKIERALHDIEEEVEILFKDNQKLELLSKWKDVGGSSNDGKEYLKQLRNKPYTFFIHRKDSFGIDLMFWSKNDVMSKVREEQFNSPSKISLIPLNKNKYIRINGLYKNPQHQVADYLLTILIPVHEQFTFENDYLINHYSIANIPASIAITDSLKDKNSATIHTQKGKDLFYISNTTPFISNARQHLLILLYFLSFILIANGLHKIATSLAQAKLPWTSFIVLLGSILLFRYFSYCFEFSKQFNQVYLFYDNNFTANNYWYALGDLLIDIALLFWVSLFFYKNYKGSRLTKLSNNYKLLSTGLIYGLVILGLWVVSMTYKTLVIDSNIPFDFKHIFSLNGYSLSAILGLNTLLLSIYLLGFRLVKIVYQLEVPSFYRLGIISIIPILTSIFIALGYIDFSPTGVFFFASTAFISLFDFFIHKNIKNSLNWVLTWLLFFAGFSTLLLHQYNKQKDIFTRLAYAKDLADLRDYNAEDEFLDLEKHISDNKFIQTYLKSYSFGKNKIVEEIEAEYSKKSYLLNKYSFDTYLYNDGKSLDYREAIKFSNWREEFKSSERINTNLYIYRDNKEEKHRYFLDISFQFDDNLEKSIFLVFTPQKIDNSRVYPELLVDDKIKQIQALNKYKYTIYKFAQKQNKGVDNDIDDEYKKRYNEEKPAIGTYFIKNTSKYSNLIYRANKEKIVIVSKEHSDWIEPVSLFSYIFCVLLIVLLGFIFLNTITYFLPNMITLRWSPMPSLRNRIHFSVIAVIILMFIVIGLVTVIYFQNSSTDYHQRRLLRKTNTVLADATYQLYQDSSKILDINPLSKIHKMDINLYDIHGELIESSQEDIFKNGLISRQIDPLALQSLSVENKSKFVQNEKIGTLEYQTAYVPLEIKRGKSKSEIIGYLGLPYYSQQSKLRRDVSDFMGTLLNVYVLLLILAGVIAVGIARSVTRPISTIGEKIKQVQIGEKNEPLEWDSDDELGALIKEYNNMIIKLEHNTKLLAKSEREDAWREMAKQVAHEIKNPLTPMKLSIQYLQRAFQSDPERALPLVKRVSTTLIEQIDNLASIATEFSTFAKMPKANNEKFEINQAVTSVYDLFNDGDDMEVNLEMCLEIMHVYADKNQFIRVLNNLIKNATQAIPDGREGVINVRLYKEDNMAIVRVSDNGTGIPEDKKDKVFQPKFTTKNSGMGLGLAIAKNIVEIARGRIYFKTETNVGTDFYVELPIFSLKDEETANKAWREQTQKFLKQD